MLPSPPFPDTCVVPHPQPPLSTVTTSGGEADFFPMGRRRRAENGVRPNLDVALTALLLNTNPKIPLLTATQHERRSRKSPCSLTALLLNMNPLRRKSEKPDRSSYNGGSFYKRHCIYDCKSMSYTPVLQAGWVGTRFLFRHPEFRA
nr:hypothetical protein Iba_chr10bCG5770 [Ipomoea batatas]